MDGSNDLNVDVAVTEKGVEVETALVVDVSMPPLEPLDAVVVVVMVVGSVLLLVSVVETFD